MRRIKRVGIRKRAIVSQESLDPDALQGQV